MYGTCFPLSTRDNGDLADLEQTRMSPINPTLNRCKAAVDEQVRTGHKGGFITSQKDGAG